MLAGLLESQYLLEILQTSLTFKNRKKVAKSRCLEKLLQWRAPIFFQNEGGTQSLLCENIDVLLNYYEVGIYVKYGKPHPLSKLVKMG